jgi:hypothetical protein
MSAIVLGYILAGVAGVGSLVCWVVILIQMFKNEKPLIGIIGVLCGPWAFIWGWMNAAKLGIKNTMLIWSACIVVQMIGIGIATTAVISHAKPMQEPDHESFAMPSR